MNIRLCSLTTFILSLTAHLALAGPVEQGSKAPSSEPVQADHPMYLGTFNTGVKTSDVYTEGHLSLVVPFWSSLGSDGILGGGVVYLAPYVSLGEQGELATSLGLGWRYLFNDQPLSALQSDTPAAFLTEGFYVGANLFVDNLRTQFDNDFWQLGLGAEIGTRYLEVRGNYYLPFDGSPKLAERSTDTQNFTSRSSRSSTRTENSFTGGDPYATQHSIVQDANLTTTAITTTSTTTTKTTVKTITSLFEEGMEGWDLEAAVLIPGLDRYLDVTLLAGYYSFDNQPFGPQRGPSGNTEGWKAGIEIRPVPALVLTGMWYEDEGLTGSDWVAGIGLQIPLGKDWQDAFKSRRRHLIERLAEPVARQNAAIKTARSVDVDQDVTQQTSTRTAVRRQIVSQSRQRIVIREDIIFVNNGDAVGNGIQAGSATGDGTAEQPYDTIQAGADHAGSNNVATQRAWNVYTQHTPTTYSESVTLSASTHLIGSFSAILSPLNGAAFGGNTPRPVVAGGFAADSAQFLPGATLPSAASITAYDISGGYSAAASLSVNVPGGINIGSGNGVYFEDIDQVIVADSLVTDVTGGNGIFLSHLGSQQATIRGNTVTASGEKGIFLTAGAFTGDISANTANENEGDGIRTEVSGGGNITGNISGNTANENSDGGIYTGVFGGGSITGNIADNTVNENEGNGIYTIVFGGGDLTGDITGNTAIQNQVDGIYTTVSIGGDLSGSITGNTANQNTYNGISTDVFNGGDISGSITGNTANENGNTGIKTQAFGGDLSGSITDNTANENRNHGFFTNVSGGGNIIGNITGNTANKNEIIGIRTDVAGGGGISGDITGNTANENEDHGIKTEVIGGGSITGNINDNTANKNLNVGVYTAVFNGGSMTGDVNGNTANENEGNGIFTMVFGGGDMTGDINGNTANQNQINGIYTSVGGGGDLTGSITGNTANQNGSEGIAMDVYNGGDITGSISGNSASQNESDGIMVQVHDGGNFTGNITDNTANENGVSGIGGGMVLYIDGTFDGTATGNTANDNPGFGFDTRATALGGSAITSPNNASGNGGGDFNTSFGVPIINP